VLKCGKYVNLYSIPVSASFGSKDHLPFISSKNKDILFGFTMDIRLPAFQAGPVKYG
jgi:hypothetical protein